MKTLTDLRKLRHVVGVARAGSFTSASNSLGITQSALTKSVAEVEHLLGMKLFHRLPRGVTTTDAGARFVPRAERILADTQELMSQLADLQGLEAGHLRIGVAPAGFVGFLQQVVSEFAARYPGIKVQITEGAVESIAAAVIQGEMDVVVGLKPNLSQWTELNVDEVFTLNPFFISRMNHPLAAHSKPTAQDLIQYPLVLPSADFTTLAQINKAYTDAGLTPRPAHYVIDHFPTIEQLVASTDALAPVLAPVPPGDTFRGRFQVYRDLVDLDSLDLAIGYAKQRDISGPAAAFSEMFAKGS